MSKMCIIIFLDSCLDYKITKFLEMDCSRYQANEDKMTRS